MYLNQLSVFIENREGRLDEVLETLKEEDINIVSLSLADSSDYGLLPLMFRVLHQDVLPCFQ